MYACPNVVSNVTIVRADRSTPGFMRAPAETPYFFALESAMDDVRLRFGKAAITRATLAGRDEGDSVPLLPD